MFWAGLSHHLCLLQVLQIHLSNQEDLFYLHTLEVSEEDFHSLRLEHGIPVDFEDFPGKIITLLERCISPKAQDHPRCGLILALLRCWLKS